VSAPDGPPAVPRAVFIVWATPLKGRRSLVLGTDLGVETVAYLVDEWRPGVVSDPLKYPRLVWRTVRVLVRHRPRVVFVQSPPTVAVWTVLLYSLMTGARYVIDAHSDAFQRTRWMKPRWLNRLAARRAAATLVTDAHWAERLAADSLPVMVVPDIPRMAPDADAPGRSSLGEGFHLLVVNTWSPDEPLKEVIAAAAELPEVSFHVTGRRDRRVDALGPLPANVRFTDFLADDAYRALMRSVDGVVCLTTRDHTMQRGACEALSLATPIVTSRWPILEGYFEAGTVHVDNTATGIRDGIRRLMSEHASFAAAVAELRARRRDEWRARRQALIALLTVQAPRTR
jgi:glycosyltransferase involved in cell wall biosynthesis